MTGNEAVNSGNPGLTANRQSLQVSCHGSLAWNVAYHLLKKSVLVYAHEGAMSRVCISKTIARKNFRYQSKDSLNRNISTPSQHAFTCLQQLNVEFSYDLAKARISALLENNS